MNKNKIHTLRELQNPYALLSAPDFGQPEERALAERVSIWRSQNPYAKLDAEATIQADVETDTSSEEIEAAELPGLGRIEKSISKREFEKACREIFVQYIPLADRRRGLTPPYRDFIQQHIGSNPEVRRRILLDLEKYDLSGMGDVEPHLNREREPALLNKLARITAGIEKREIED